MDYSIDNEFTDVDLGDKRLTKRVVKIANALSKNPEESICSAINSFHDCKAAYRLFANYKVTPEKLSAVHIKRATERASAIQENILIVHDTTSLLYDKFSSIEGLGCLTTRPGMQQGLQGILLHNSLMATESGVPLGIIKQSYFNYEDYLHKRKQKQRNVPGINKQYPVEKKASWRWIQHLIDTEAICNRFSNKNVTHVADREGDIYEFLQISQELSTNYVVRARGERRVHLSKEGSRKTTTISNLLSQAEELGQVVIEVNSNNHKQQNHTMSIKVVKALLHPPSRHQDSMAVGKLVPIEVNVVEVCSLTEPDFQWRLFTNINCFEFEKAVRIINIYKARWMIENYHRVLKSGFKIESARLASRARLENFCTLVSILAWRIMWLYLFSRDKPDIPCKEILSEMEIKVIELSENGKKDVEQMTLCEAILFIAKLGGFLNRKSDGLPGMKAIWKGWRALYERIKFLEEMSYG